MTGQSRNDLDSRDRRAWLESNTFCVAFAFVVVAAIFGPVIFHLPPLVAGVFFGLLMVLTFACVFQLAMHRRNRP